MLKYYITYERFFMDYRKEHDSMGTIEVENDKYWGAATERSRRNFTIGGIMPIELIRALGKVKLAAARANAKLVPSRMTAEKLKAIELAANEVISGALDDHFPLRVYQTGSGTQTNMNVNEVIARRGGEALGISLHPNDDVNMSQSSNDVFPTAMHLAAAEATVSLTEALCRLRDTFLRLEDENRGVIKCGRTHLQDATPIAFSDEISGWRASVECDIEMLGYATSSLMKIALGGTAVGTGINAPKGFAELAADELVKISGLSVTSADNKFHALSSKSELAFAHGAIKAAAADLMKIANDVRLLASGPRCGLGEITIPENEPGSSIMPGKVNPTQCEAVTMVAVRIMGNDATIGFAASQGNFELNVFMPVIIDSYLESAKLLTEAANSFRERCADGICANRAKMEENLNRTLMTATALNTHIGYEATAKIVKLAHQKDITLREAAIALGELTAEKFDEIFHPENMI